jgi:hypothetical protein
MLLQFQLPFNRVGSDVQFSILYKREIKLRRLTSIRLTRRCLINMLATKSQYGCSIN